MTAVSSLKSMPASAADASVARGRVERMDENALVLWLPDTDYRLRLALDAPMSAEVGRRISGRILARAMRVDRVGTGGRFIEPVFGPPRRLQGRIIATDADANTITLQCPCPITCELTANQRAGDFHIGELVAFDVKAGTRFEPIEQDR